MGDDRVKRVLCVCSGGLDSTVAATIAKNEGYELYMLHINYRHRAEKKEIEAVKKVAEALDAKETKFVDTEFLKEFKNSSLTDDSLEVPTDEEVDLNATKTPSTWVPCRNLVLLAFASSYAESIGAETIFVGFNAEEAQSYPDNTPEFVGRFNRLLEKSVASFTKAPQVEAPLIKMFKRDIVRKAVEVNAPIELTWSCYFNYDKHCGRCEACQHRKRGFREAGVKDSIEYLE